MVEMLNKYAKTVEEKKGSITDDEVLFWSVRALLSNSDILPNPCVECMNTSGKSVWIQK